MLIQKMREIFGEGVKSFGKTPLGVLKGVEYAREM
jgi:hypothetical protein